MTTPFKYAASGGTLNPDDPSYITRQADTDLYEALQQGKYCYVLNSRQVGKSSLLVRTALRLRQENINVAVMELTKLGSSNATAEKWYRSLLDVIGRQLGKRAELVAFWKEHEEFDALYRWMQAVQHVVLSSSESFVICLDEIDSVQTLPFSTDEFFAAIRECFNARTQQPELQRLTFCLVGVVTPSELIRDPRITPFNIGQRIDLTDLTLTEMAPLAQGLQREAKVAQVLLQRIVYWTNGHPYLTQKLCQAVAEDASVTSAAGVDRVCEVLFLSSRSRDNENNLQHVRTMLLTQKTEEEQSAILDLYRQVRRTKRVKDDDTSRIIGVLRLAGLVKVYENYLWVRNHVYFRVFDEAWIVANMPDAEQQRQRAAQRRGFLQATGIATVVVAIVASLAIWGWLAQQEASRQEAIAIQQKNLALQAVSTLTYEQIDELLKKAPLARQSILEIFGSNIKTLEAIYALTPADPKAQREKSVNLNKIGDTWMILGNTQEALQAYQQTHEILKRLVTADPDSAEAQRDLSFSYNKLGNVQRQLGNTQEALQAYQQSLDIRKRLATADPDNAQAQRDLSVSYEKLGDVQLQLGNTQEALQAYQQGFDIRKRLATADPDSAEAQRDLSVSYNKLGDVQLQLGNTQEALQVYQQSLDIRKHLATADPDNAQAQWDLSISYYKLAQTHVSKEQLEEALAKYQQALSITEKLVTRDKLNQQWQNDLSTLQRKIAEIQARLEKKEK